MALADQMSSMTLEACPALAPELPATSVIVVDERCVSTRLFSQYKLDDLELATREAVRDAMSAHQSLGLQTRGVHVTYPTPHRVQAIAYETPGSGESWVGPFNMAAGAGSIGYLICEMMHKLGIAGLQPSEIFIAVMEAGGAQIAVHANPRTFE